MQVKLQDLAESNRISVSNLLDPADEEDVLEVVIVKNLSSTIVQSSFFDENVEEEEEVSQFSDDEKLEMLANACTFLDMVGLMTEDVERQFYRAKRVLRLQKIDGMC